MMFTFSLKLRRRLIMLSEKIFILFYAVWSICAYRPSAFAEKIAPVRGITGQMYLFFSYPGQKELKKEAVPNIFILILIPPKIKSLV